MKAISIFIISIVMTFMFVFGSILGATAGTIFGVDYALVKFTEKFYKYHSVIVVQKRDAEYLRNENNKIKVTER